MSGSSPTKTVPQPASPPQVKVIEVAPSAKPAYMRPRHWLILLGFLCIVVIPTGLVGYYLYNNAADQYASKVGFTVRKEESSTAFDLLGGLSNISGSSSSDTDILYEFIQSQELVRSVDEELNLRMIYNLPENDPVFTLGEDVAIEDLVEYWARMVRIVYDPGSGLMEIEIRSFTPEDSKAIAESIFRHSSAMINELTAIAREDLTRYAKFELEQAVERLKSARQAVTRFRNETQIVDPGADIQGQMGVLNSLQSQLAETLIELDLLAETARKSDPRVATARRKIEVIENRIAEERRKVGVSDEGEARVFADLVGEYESLQVDLQFAQESYLSAQASYDSTVAEARRQSRYLAAYIHPSLAETALYPKREILLAVAVLVLFGFWAIGTLIFYSLRDRG